MKKILLITLTLLLMSWGINAQTAIEPVGNGSTSDPYQIATLENLYWISVNPSSWDKHFIQMNDIDASATNTWDDGKGWLAIGTSTSPFYGTYDGMLHTISNLYINRPYAGNQGLFGYKSNYLSQISMIKNLGVTNVNINGRNNIGGLVGFNFGDVSNCYSTGSVVGSDVEVGGLVGQNKGSITYCYSEADVTGNWLVGGLVGNTNGYGSEIINCYSRGSVTSVSENAGGLVGVIKDDALIRNCYSTGLMNNSGAGGLVGLIDGGGSVVNSFWDVETSGVTVSAGGTAKTTAEMKIQSTFTGWEFMTIWSINPVNNDGYPHLITESACVDGILPLISGSNNQTLYTNTSITPIVYYVGGGASGVSISPAFIPLGLSGVYDPVNRTFTISGLSQANITYNYSLTTTGTKFPCKEATVTGSIKVIIQPSVNITGTNSPICYGSDAKFYLQGTTGVEVTYSLDGGTTTSTVILVEGKATIEVKGATSDKTLSLISARNIEYGCTFALKGTSAVIVNNLPAASISGDHEGCVSTTLTAGTDASTPIYEWYKDGVLLAGGSNSTLVATQAGSYAVKVTDGITKCSNISDDFAVILSTHTVSITANNQPICYGSDAEFYLEGTPGTVVTYSFDGGTSQSTVPLDDGRATVIYKEVTGDITLSLISIELTATGCTRELTETSTVEIYIPTAIISGNQVSCVSTTLTAETDALMPIYEWHKDGALLAGESSSTLTVTQSGAYTLMVSDGSTKCSNISGDFNVTINPLPEVTITGNNSSICYITNAEFYLEGTPGAEVTYNFNGGTNRTRILGEGITKVHFDEAPYDITLSLVSIKDNLTGCSKFLDSQSTVTVNPDPDVSIDGYHEDCLSTTLRAVTDTPNPVYAWLIVEDEEPIQVGDGSTLEVTQSDDYYLFVTDKNSGCFGFSGPFAVSINPLPAVAITSNMAINAGGTTNLSPTEGGTWISNNPTVALVDVTGEVTGISSGTATFTFTDTETDCSATTEAITVTAASQTNTQTFTADGTFTVPEGVTSVTVKAWGGGGGGSFRYLIDDTDVYGPGAGGGGGSYCGGTVDVTPGEKIYITIGLGGFGGSDINPDGETGGESRLDNESGTWSIIARGGSGGYIGSEIAEGGTGGSTYYTPALNLSEYFGGSGASGYSSDGNTYGGGAGGGAGDSQNGSDAIEETGGTGGNNLGGKGGDAGNDGQTYGGGGGGAGNVESTSVGNGADGAVIISWIPVGECTPPTPTFTESPLSPQCIDNEVTYTTQADKTDYVWSISGTENTDYKISSGGTSSDNTVTLTWLTDGSNKTVTVNYTEDCEGETPASSTITVNPLPDATFATTASNTPVCEGGNAEFYLTGTANAVVSYSITDIYGETNNTVTLNPSGEATVLISGVSKNQTMQLNSVQNPATECATNLSAQSSVEVKRLPEANFDTPASNSPVCSGEDAHFDILATPGCILTYNLNGSAENETVTIDASGEWQLNFLNVESNITIQLISIEYPDGTCPVGLESSSTITVSTPPNAGTINGMHEMCAGETAILKVDGDEGGTWASSNENVANISQNGEVEGIDAGSATIKYTVLGTGGCEGEEDFTTFEISVSAPPAAPTAEAQQFCSADNPIVAHLKPSSDGLVFYNWYNTSDGVTLLDGATALSTGTYYVSQIENGCESARTPVDVTVYTTPAAPTAEAQLFCIGDDPRVSSLKASGEEGATFSWYDSESGGWPISGKVNLTNGTYYVSQTVNGCESARTAVYATVDDMPEAGELEGRQLICAGTSAKWTVFEGDEKGTWSSSNTTVAEVSETGEVFGKTPGSASISYTVQGSGGCEGKSDAATMSVTIVKQPEAGEITGPEGLCIGATAQLSSNGDLGSWTSLDDDVLSVDNNGLVTAVGAGYTAISYYVEGIGGCKGDEAIIKILVYSNSVAPLSVVAEPETSESGAHVCPGDAVTLTVSGGDLGTNPKAEWTWYKGSCGGELLGTGVSINVFPTENSTYFVRAEGCNITECASVDVWVWPETEITVQPSDALISYGCVATLVVEAAGQGLAYQWYQNSSQSNTGGTLISGATNNEYWPDCSVSGVFYYYVMVTGSCTEVASHVATLTIDPQAASATGILYYTGPKFAFTQNENSGTATMVVSATIRNNVMQVCNGEGILNPDGGDIRTALLSFEIDKGNGWEPIAGATNLPVDYIDPNNIELGGTAAAIVKIDIGSESAATCELRVVVSGNYTGKPDKMKCPLTIVRPQAGGIIMGTVGLCNETSAGFIKGMTGDDYNGMTGDDYNTVLNFEVKYSETVKVRGADQSKGKVWLLISSLYNSLGIKDGAEHTYLITSNAIADFAISCPKAHFSAKANVVELLENGQVNSIEGNCTMVLDLEKGQTCDKVGITVYKAKSKGGIWYSNNWVNGKTVPTCICSDDFEIGGCNAVATSTEKTKSVEITRVDSDVEFADLKVYPNPFSEKLRFEFVSPETVNARIELYDMAGRMVKTIFEQPVEGGTKYEAEFRPETVISGMYFYRVTMGETVYNGKVIFKKE